MTKVTLRAARVCTLAVLATAMLAPEAEAQLRAPELRVMSFNIRYGTAADGADAWPLRRAHVLEYLRRERPDVLGLQEALRGQLDDLAAGLRGYAEVGVGREDGRAAGEYAAILFRADRFDLLASGTFWFSDTPDVPGSASWGNRVTRICTWARLHDRLANRALYVYNVHLDHESQPSRERSVAALMAAVRAREHADAVVLTGDLNAGEDNPAVRALRELLTDTYRALHPRAVHVGTFNAFRGDSTGPKIDYVFADAGFETARSRIERPLTPGGRQLSDHFPVTATLRFAAAEDVHEQGELETITVTATRVERRVEEQVLRVDVVGAEEVAEKVAMTPGDVVMLLNETGGLRAQPVAPSLGGVAVRIHGLDGRHTLVLADGLPLHGQSGSFGLLQVPPMDLRQVEIVKGAASAMWGGGGLGGLVNFVSRRPTGEHELLLNGTTLGGADAVYFGSGFLGGAAGWTLLAGAHGQPRSDRDDDGWTDVAWYRRAVVRPRLFVEPGGGRSLLATAGFTVEERRGGTLPGSSPLPGSQSFAEELDTRRADVGLVARDRTASGLELGARASLAGQAHRHVFGSAGDDDTHFEWLAEATLGRHGGTVEWLAGLAFAGQRFRSDQWPVFDHTYSVPGVFGQAVVQASRRATLGASVRLDHHSEVGWQVSPRVSVRYGLGPLWTARISAGAGYSVPTPFTGATEEVGLANLESVLSLRSEHGYSVSADVGGPVGPVELSVAVFGGVVERPAHVRDVSPPFVGGPRPVNLGLVHAPGPRRHAGLDLIARWRDGPWHVTGSVGALTATEDLTGSRVDVPLTPRQSAGIVAAWERGATRVGAELYYTGSQRLDNNTWRTESPAYVVTGLIVQRRFGRALVFLNLENLGDMRVTREHPLVNQVYIPETGWTTDAWAPTEGRVINAGVRLRL